MMALLLLFTKKKNMTKIGYRIFEKKGLKKPLTFLYIDWYYQNLLKNSEFENFLDSLKIVENFILCIKY